MYYKHHVKAAFSRGSKPCLVPKAVPVARFQVLLRWAVQKGIAVTPKSNKAECSNAQPGRCSSLVQCEESRLRENLEVLDFVLEEEDLAWASHRNTLLLNLFDIPSAMEDMKLLDALDKEQVFYWNTSLLVPDVAPAPSLQWDQF